MQSSGWIAFPFWLLSNCNGSPPYNDCFDKLNQNLVLGFIHEKWALFFIFFPTRISALNCDLRKIGRILISIIVRDCLSYLFFLSLLGFWSAALFFLLLLDFRSIAVLSQNSRQIVN